MLSLETRAKELFEEYSLAHSGKVVSWDYLNAKRRLAWMRDVYFIAERLIEDLKLRINPYHLSDVDTVYASGFNEGIKTERVKLLHSLELIELDLERQVEEFKKRNEIS